LDECRTLLDLYRNPERQSGHVKDLVLDKIDHLDQQLASLTAMRAALGKMAKACVGNEAPQCAILDSLAKPVLTSNMAFTLVEVSDE
jgi:MerR family copper efflux transcriptional regulator